MTTGAPTATGAGRGRHVDEATPPIDVPLVRRLLDAQFPQWADRPLDALAWSGTDNAIFRLGDDLSVRLPRSARLEAVAAREHRWLRRFAPLLPLEIPVPVALGRPNEDFPWPWSIHRWIEGEHGRLAGDHGAAAPLGAFVAALGTLDPGGGNRPGPDNVFRGAPLEHRDHWVQGALPRLGDRGLAERIGAVWRDALAEPGWDRTGVWLHGDLHDGNLLLRDGRLAAVIDFGCMAVGDPACDLMVAWNLPGPADRAVFRSSLPHVDDATWRRGRAWALAVWTVGLVGRVGPLAASARHVIAQVLDDVDGRTTL